MLLAVALAVGGYSLLLAWQRADLALAARPTWTDPPRLPAAAPLPRATGVAPILPASVTKSASRRRLTVQFEHLPPDLASAAAGVATFASSSGSDLQWRPLLGATPTLDTTHTVTIEAGTAATSVTLALGPEFARHGYLARAEVAAGDRDAMLTIDAMAAAVTFTLPPGASFAGPFCLQRIDDAAWLSMSTGSSGLCLQPGRATQVLLGRGSYRLCDPLSPQNSQPFEVPAVTQLAVSPVLARTRGDRP
ncbi:MAG: hypothetical protein JNN13_04655 [Planctomycetes bacterium]|nr:hypothetical protein [Planctomycetota bacterium]